MTNEIDDVLIQDDEHTFHFNYGGQKASASKTPNVHAVNNNNCFVLAVDCDDVLVNITDKWVRKLLDHPILNTYFKAKHHDEMRLSNSALTRSNYSLIEWLEITDKEHVSTAYDLYFKDPTFYDDLNPTPFAESLTSAALDKIGELHVVTACGYDTTCPANLSKKKWLAKFLRSIGHNVKTEFKVHMLPYGVAKGKFMHDNGIKFNTFVDDAPYNVIEVANSTPYSNYEIMIPCYGFNQNLTEMREKMTGQHNFRIVGFHNMASISSDALIEKLKSSTSSEEANVA